MRATAHYRGNPVELRPNEHPRMPKVVVRDPLGNIIEEVHYEAGKGIVIALDDLPRVGQLAIVPPGGATSLILPGA
jgi:hypothetical protein